MKRILTAIVALPILLYTVWIDVPYYFVALTAVAVLLALIEFYRLATKAGCQPHHVAGCLAGMAVLASFLFDSPSLGLGALAALAMVSFALSIARPEQMGRAIASVSATVFGVVYVAVLGGFLVGIRMTLDAYTQPPTPKLSAKILTAFFAMVMLTDTFAYYTGRALGRKKLAPSVSPGKTVEGSVGGFAGAILAGLACRLVFFPELPALHAVVLGATVGIVAQVGDLAESLLKRASDVKDSGAIFPGHGGMLDRLDSLLFCAPILYYYSRLFMPSSG